MKTLRTTLKTAAIPLLLAALPVGAAELPFNAPQTALAQENSQLLHQAARALGALPTTATLASSGQHIANLWIFPTADTDTVFAQYQVTSSQQGGPSTQYLTVLKVRDNRIVEQTDLTDARAYAASGQERPTATAHWTASIGTGRAASTQAASSSAAASDSHGVPATANWTARIGTGTAASSTAATQSKQVSASNGRHAVADAHWTSRIGTGHAADSNGQERT